MEVWVLAKMEALRDFMASERRNAWLLSDDGNVEVYFRKAFRAVEGVPIDNVLDVANIVVKFSQRGKGLFTSVVNDIEVIAKDNGYMGIFVESVIEPRLIDFFEKRGYRRVSSLYNENFYKDM
jgi:N-acetylglutamate synthase-like GNAT family acetyltransferase